MLCARRRCQTLALFNFCCCLGCSWVTPDVRCVCGLRGHFPFWVLGAWLAARAPWGAVLAAALIGSCKPRALHGGLLARLAHLLNCSLLASCVFGDCPHARLGSWVCESLWKPCAQHGCDGFLSCSGCARRHLGFGDAPCNPHSPSTMFLHVFCKLHPSNKLFRNVSRELHLPNTALCNVARKP